MELIWEGHLIGIFEGYAYDRVFALSDSTRWRQASEICEYVYRENPRARLVCDYANSSTYLDVEGTSARVLVERDRGWMRRGAGAY